MTSLYAILSNTYFISISAKINPFCVLQLEFNNYGKMKTTYEKMNNESNKFHGWESFGLNAEGRKKKTLKSGIFAK